MSHKIGSMGTLEDPLARILGISWRERSFPGGSHFSHDSLPSVSPVPLGKYPEEPLQVTALFSIKPEISMTHNVSSERLQESIQPICNMKPRGKGSAPGLIAN